MLNAHVHAVIMAGGTSKALWPVARKRCPVQCLDLFHEATMLELTIRRIMPLVPPERILVVTGREGRECLQQSGLELPPENIIAEPVARNTAPCIALATVYIRARDPEAITIVLPSDHDVRDQDVFAGIIEAGVLVASEKTGLVTIGVRPSYPETEYGYIQTEEQLPDKERETGGGAVFSLYRVRTFAEKPDRNTAVHFLESRDFFWNSGIFIWHVDAISREFERSLPDLHKDFANISRHLHEPNIDDLIETAYSWIRPVSIDYGIMEKADPVYMLEGDFGWTDLVSWDELARVSSLHECAAADGENETLRMGSSGVFLRKPAGKVVCMIGVKDLIVVDTGDALLLCARGESHRVSAAVDQLRRDKKDAYL